MSYLEALSCKKHRETSITTSLVPGVEGCSSVHTTDICDSCDWYIAALPGGVFMEDVASGSLRSAKGRMVRQDCRY